MGVRGGEKHRNVRELRVGALRCLRGARRPSLPTPAKANLLHFLN